MNDKHNDASWDAFCNRMAEAWERMAQHHDWLAMAAQVDLLRTAEQRKEDHDFQRVQAKESRRLADSYRTMMSAANEEAA